MIQRANRRYFFHILFLCAYAVSRLSELLTITPRKIKIKFKFFLSDVAPSGTLLSRENFKGCIRNVVIRGELKDWTDMDELQNVLLSECLAIT